MACKEGEARAAVLEREAGVLGNDGGAETAIEGVDEGGAVAPAVSYGEIDGIAVLVRWGAMREGGGCLVGIEEFSSRCEIGGREHRFGRDILDIWVCDEPVGIREGYTERFDYRMEISVEF